MARARAQVRVARGEVSLAGSERLLSDGMHTNEPILCARIALT